MKISSTNWSQRSVEDEGRCANKRNVSTPYELIGSSYTEDDSWYFVGSVENKQGWKVYVSSTAENYVSTLPYVVGILSELKIPFKYLRSESLVRRANAGVLGLSQVGKCIVAYLTHDHLAGPLATGLKAALAPLNHCGPCIPRLPTLWPGASVFYRYGSYASKSLSLPSGTAEDDRNNPLKVADHGIGDPFLKFGGGRHVAWGSRSLAKFPIVGEFCRSGKGGVFLALDLSADVLTQVVVKIGLKNGQVAGDGRDAFDMVVHESEIYDWLGAADLARHCPRKIDAVSDVSAYCLIVEHVDSPNMASLNLGGKITIEMLEDALKVIRIMNRAGVIIVDAKLANFIHTGSECRLIDLESAFVPDDGPMKSRPGASTFDLKGLSVGDARFDEIHFLVSCLYRCTDSGNDSGSSRLIDVRDFAWHRKVDGRTESFVQSRLRDALCKL